jgi:hypothetical protein
MCQVEKRPAIFVACRAEHVRERERELPVPRAELEPPLARSLDAGADQRDVIRVLHEPMVARVRGRSAVPPGC